MNPHIRELIRRRWFPAFGPPGEEEHIADVRLGCLGVELELKYPPLRMNQEIGHWVETWAVYEVLDGN